MNKGIATREKGEQGTAASLFRLERRTSAAVSQVLFTLCALLLILIIIALFYFIGSNGLAIFVMGRASPLTFLASSDWRPDHDVVGAFVFIFGSMSVTALAILMATPLSVGAAIFMTEIAPGWGTRLLQPAIELFVGIPSVVYGWIGLTVLVPLIRQHFGGVGFSLLAGGLVLAVMILPTVTSIATDSLRRLPIALKEASLAIGATRWQMIWHVLVPAALPGILTAIILGIGRAIGEALAVQMVIGNSPRLPHSIFEPASTLTSIITMDMGNAVPGSVWSDALWSMALLLLLISFLLILTIRLFVRRIMV
ncbi:MAG: phosphate ABC transporter permease subunit PstC [Chloroflexi bacterium]|nr:phosphate ABC transporter permease subunit PstC [Chloroflexota bacterium]MCL5074386.1 phosphate ABC transporter permease subunit PstC [Chloroflexota bacterium]